MKRALRSVSAAIALGVVALVALASCLGPTQIVLHVTTNLPCTDPTQWSGVAVFVGTPGDDVETKAATLTSSTCDASGQVGTLVIVPTGAKDAEIGIRVVAGVTRNPEDCVTADYRGCIVARRTIRFSPHGSLDVYVPLTAECVGLACDPTHTCTAGSCVDSQTDPAAVSGDGGLVGPTVRCGDNGVVCPTSGDVCCLTLNAGADAGTTTGECKNPKDCPPTSSVLNCDDESDCAGARDDAGRPNLCCLSYTTAPLAGTWMPNGVVGSQCISYSACLRDMSSVGLELCDDRQPCIDRTHPCIASEGNPSNPLPGYFWCHLP